MATITTRAGKGSPLTNTEVDANFTNLNADKLESTDLSVSTGAASGGGTLSYSAGVFTFAPADLSSYITDLSSFTTTDLTEGTNLYYTDERVDDRVNSLIQAGLGITTSYDDINNELTIESDTIEELCKNGTGSTILKGTPVYQTGTAGNAMVIAPADASSAATMPAVGVLSQDLAADAEGSLILMGRISGVNTSAFSEGDVIYVASGGGYTNVRPTGQSVLVQNLGRVTKVDASNGGGVVMGSGRANDVPNLTDGYVFIGNAGGTYDKRALVAADITDATVSVTDANLASFVTAFTLPVSDGTSGQALTTNGAGDLSFSTIEGYSDADVDSHLNQSTATTAQVLSWNGSDYAWIDGGGDPTLGTLTKTFTTGESSTINLTSSVLAPVVSVTKEVPQSGVTNNNWDVNSTTENYTRINSAYATTLGWESSGGLGDLTFSSSFSASAQSSLITDIAFNTDGTKMFVLDYSNNQIDEYSLSVAYNITTASYTQNISVNTNAEGPCGIAFNSDGTKVFVLGIVAKVVAEYALSTAFNISTLTYSQNFSVNSQDANPRGIAFNTDGTKMFFAGQSGQAVYEYTLSTGFDVSTASYVDSFSVSSQASQPFGLAFNAAGEEMYVVDLNGDVVYKYNLSTAFDVSTASYSSESIYLNSVDTSMSGIFIASDLFFFSGYTNNNVYKYLAPTTLALGTGSFASADVGKTIEANDGVFVLTAADGSYVETTAPTSYDQVASGSWEMYGVVYNAADGDLELSSGVISTITTLDAFGDSSAVALYQLDGNANDTGGTYNGTWTGTAAYTTGKFSQAASFNGSSHIDTGVTYNPSNTVRTISFWVNTSTNQLKHISILEGADNSGLYFNGFGLAYYINTGSGISTGFTLTSGTWHHVVWVIGNGINKIYADNTLLVNTSVSVNNSTHEIVMNSGITPSVCLVDQYRVFNKELSAEEVSALYTEGQLFFPTGYHPVHTTASTDTQYWTDINSMTADQAAGDGNVYYAISTDDRTTWTVIDNTDGERDIVRNNAGTWQYNSNGTYASETWTNATTNTELAALAEAMEAGVGTINGFNLSTAAYSQNFSVSSQEIFPRGSCFNSDGTKMFVVGTNSDNVNEYNLSTAFDLSTASYSQNFSVSGQDGSPVGIAFNTDGTKMFVVGESGDNVYEYTLSSGYSVSTASYSQSFSVSSQDTSPQSLAFNTDGTKMFVVGLAGQDVNEYTLSTGFNLSTASYSQNFSVSAQETQPRGIAFNTDGTKMFIAGSGGVEINEYNLSTGFDISTSSFSRFFSVSAQETLPVSISFSNDGGKMFVLGYVGQDVNEYTMGEPFFINQMDKTQLDAVTDPNHIALGNDLDLAIVFNMTSGATVPSSDGVAINYDANVLNKGAVLGTDYDFDAPAGDKARITALTAGNFKVRVV